MSPEELELAKERLTVARVRNMARIEDRMRSLDEKIIELRQRGERVMDIAKKLDMKPSYVQRRLSDLRHVDQRLSAIRKAVAALRADA